MSNIKFQHSCQNISLRNIYYKFFFKNLNQYLHGDINMNTMKYFQIVKKRRKRRILVF